jgi:hypothetical protein
MLSGEWREDGGELRRTALGYIVQVFLRGSLEHLHATIAPPPLPLPPLPPLPPYPPTPPTPPFSALLIFVFVCVSTLPFLPLLLLQDSSRD